MKCVFNFIRPKDVIGWYIKYSDNALQDFKCRITLAFFQVYDCAYGNTRSLGQNQLRHPFCFSGGPDRGVKQRELDGLLVRDRELDKLFEHIYEDNVAGKISDERFAKMSRGYEQEQGEASVRIKTLKAELKKDNGKLYTADSFLEVVRYYTDALELTGRMVTELIDHIVVYHAERVDGLISQQVIVHYNCIGAFEVPAWENIPDFDILIEARKGVTYCYSPLEKAV